MPAQVVSKTMRPSRRDIYVVVMDDYGAEMHLALPVSISPADRNAKLEAVIVTMNAGEQSMESAAAAEGIDISALKAGGLKKRTARTQKH